MSGQALDRRTPLGVPLPTPIQPLARLGAELGLGPGRLVVKRDDLTALAGGGNKARKLEYLCADALDNDADVLVTGGGRQSNHVRMTAAAANRLGLGCVAVLASGEPDHAHANVLVDRLLGATLRWAGPIDFPALEAAILAEADRLRAEGRRPYVAPIGGASPVGTLGYVAAADELRAQVDDLALVVVADGSGGTHAGLAAGLGDHSLVLGVDVGTNPALDESVPALARRVAQLAGRDEPGGELQLDVEHFGAGYGEPTDSCREALALCAELEGLLLDPVYTGKAMAGLVAAAREGRLPTAGTLCFVHTGGTPALFDPRYESWLT